MAATATTRKRKSESLCEIAYSDSLRINKDAGVIHGVKVLGRESKNGRTYSDTALREAAEAYEGIGVNLDHPERSNPRADRSVRDRFGELRDVKLQADGVFADLHYNRKHPLAESIVETAERFPRQLGLSHNADGVTTVSGRTTLVEHIERVRSVDLVSKPATNKSLFESEPEPVKKTIKQILESVSDKKIAGYTRLLEMVEGDPSMGDMPVEMPDASAEAGDQKPEDQIRAGIMAAIMSKLESAKPEELEAVLAALGMGDSLSAAAAGKAKSSDGGGKSGDKSETTTESEREKSEMDQRIKSLMESVDELKAERNALKAENSARALLESLDREATPVRIRALIALESEADRKALINEWPKRTASGHGTSGPPRRTQPLTESEQPGEYKPLPAKDWAAAVR